MASKNKEKCLFTNKKNNLKLIRFEKVNIRFLRNNQLFTAGQDQIIIQFNETHLKGHLSFKFHILRELNRTSFKSPLPHLLRLKPGLSQAGGRGEHVPLSFWQTS